MLVKKKEDAEREKDKKEKKSHKSEQEELREAYEKCKMVVAESELERTLDGLFIDRLREHFIDLCQTDQ